MFPQCISRAAALALCASATAAGPALAAPPATTPAPSGHAPARATTAAPPTSQAQPKPTRPTKHHPAKSTTPTKHHPKKPTNVWTVTWKARTGAAPVVDPSRCTTPVLTQPFLGWHDQNRYTLAPGQSADDFAGTGWVLGGGASIRTQTLADGRSGHVLDLPVGGYAVSPPTCVETDYPTARTMVQTRGTAHVGAGVFYAARSTHSLRLSGVLRGAGSGFTPSRPFQVHPGRLPGWQMVQFVLGAAGTRGDAQIYNFYVDPRMLR